MGFWCLGFGVSAPLHGADWPHLRGPHYDGTSLESNLAETWRSNNAPVVWNIELGRGYSSFAAVGGRLYTQTQRLAGQFVVCLDAESGNQLWEYNHDRPYEPASIYPGPRSTPTVAGDLVYALSPRGILVCLRASDGGEVWSVSLPQRFQAKPMSYGYSASPLVFSGKVIIPTNNPGPSLVALDAATGATVWTSGTDHISYASVIPITVHGQPQLLALLRNHLVGVAPNDGKQLWRLQISSGYDERSNFPLYREPQILLAAPFRDGAQMIRLDKTTEGLAPKVVWRTAEFSNDTASSVLAGNFVYGFDIHDVQTKAQRPSRGEFKCLEWQTGKIRWTTDRVGHATVLVADGKLILFNDRGELLLARVNPDRYEELARAQIFSGEICWSAPAFHNGRLYLRSPTHATCVDLRATTQATPSKLPSVQTSAFSDLTFLLGHEREYMFDAPEFRDLARWFAVCLVVLIAAATATLPARRLNRRSTTPVFLIVCFLFGLVATPVAGRFAGEFTFTWPLALFAMYQFAVVAALRAKQATHSPSSSLAHHSSHFSLLTSPVTHARLAALALIGVCIGYYLLCRRLSLGMEWTYLVGLLPAWPLAVLAARELLADDHPIFWIGWNILAFTFYFGSSAAFLHVKTIL